LYVLLALVFTFSDINPVIAGVPFFIYAVVQKLNIPIQAQATIFTTLSLITWGQCLYYHDKLGLLKSIAAPVACALIFAGIEVGVVIGYRPSYEAGNTRPIMAIGIIAAILLAAGLLPPYWEIWKRRGQVVGISFLFITIDALGAVFSMLSLVAQKGEFDIVAGVQYGVIILLEAGILVLGAIWKVRCWARNRNGVIDSEEAGEVGEAKEGGVSCLESGSTLANRKGGEISSIDKKSTVSKA